MGNIKNMGETEYGDISGEIYFKLANNKIDLLVDKGTDIEYAEECINYVNNLKDNVIEEICKSAINSYEECLKDSDYLEYFDLDIPLSINGREILKYIKFKLLMIENNDKHKDIAFSLSGECMWDDSHDYEWVIRDGKVLYMGWCENISPWLGKDDYSKEEYNFSCNYYRSTGPVKLTEEQINKIKNNKSNKVKSNEFTSKTNFNKHGVNFSWIFVLFLIVIFGIALFVSISRFVEFRKIVSHSSSRVIKIIDKDCRIEEEYDSDYGHEEVEKCSAILEYNAYGKTYYTDRTEYAENIPEKVYYEKNNPSKYYLTYDSMNDLAASLIITILFFSISLYMFIYIIILNYKGKSGKNNEKDIV